MADAVKDRMNLLLQEKQKNQRLQQLRRDTLRKVEFLKSKAIIEHHDVYTVIRDFFKEFLERRYEFTVTELRQELKHVYISNGTRQQIAGILERLEAAEYTTVHYTKEDLLTLLTDFQSVVTALVHLHTSSKTWIDRIKAFIFKEEEQHTILAELPVIEDESVVHVRIYTLIEKCYVALDKHNLHRAKVAYDVLLQEYGQLDEDQKVEFYDIIQQTCRDLLARAKMLE